MAATEDAQRFSYSAPQVAKMLGMSLPKLHQFIRSGELKCRNLRAKREGQRPRYRILHRDLEAFLDARTVRQPPAAPTRRRTKTADVPEYY